MADSTKTCPCPKCGRVLKQSGEISVGDSPALLPVFQCDECLVDVEIFGETTEAALTFCIGADGQPFDPADPDRVLRF